MSRRGTPRFTGQYYSAPPTNGAPYLDADPGNVMPGNYDQSYYYPSYGYAYYVPGPLIPAQQLDATEHWSTEVHFQDSYYASLSDISTNPIPPFPASTFSVEAPEFVSKYHPVHHPADSESTAQTEGGNPNTSAVPIPRKKKKQKKKKKNGVDTAVKSGTSDEGVPVPRTHLVPPLERKLVHLKGVRPVKAVKFSDVDYQSEHTKVMSSPTMEGKPPNYSLLFKDQKSSPSLKAEAKQDEGPNKRVDGTPKSKESSPQMADSPATKKVATTFADKLKNPPPSKSPFLDWRDQRTAKANELITRTPEAVPESTNPAARASSQAEPAAPSDDGFVEVKRRKAKDSKPLGATAPPSDPQPAPAKKLSPEEEAKKRADKEKKKQREREKKQRARETKLLQQKLMPKSQKITIITPKMMDKYLQSGRHSVKASANHALKLEDNRLFPELSRGNRGRSLPSESESEWETTEVQEVQPVKASPLVASEAAPAKNVKRSDPIQLDLMALITKKSNRKPQPMSQVAGKSRKPQGVIANVLDRSAPVLSRGKIRKKKQKFSEIRKALLAAKAKKKLQALVTSGPGVRPNPLHSKKFREYCDQVLTDEIDQLSADMLYHLRMFQDRAFLKDPIKGRMKKRLVAGLREVTKQVVRKRIKMIFLAPDIQRCPETGGLDEAVRNLLDLARQADLPVVYALSRRKLGRVLKKNVPVSCCGIFNHQATEETWKKLSSATAAARKEYQIRVQQLGLTPAPMPNAVLETAPEMPSSRQPEFKQTDALLQLMKLSLKSD